MFGCYTRAKRMTQAALIALPWLPRARAKESAAPRERRAPGDTSCPGETALALLVQPELLSDSHIFRQNLLSFPSRTRSHSNTRRISPFSSRECLAGTSQHSRLQAAHFSTSMLQHHLLHPAQYSPSSGSTGAAPLVCPQPGNTRILFLIVSGCK